MAQLKPLMSQPYLKGTSRGALQTLNVHTKECLGDNFKGRGKLTNVSERRNRKTQGTESLSFCFQTEVMET